jgi:hypothetical protein
VHRLTHQLLHGVHFGDWIGRELLVIHLEMIALDEERSAEALSQRGGDHHGHVLCGPLFGIPDLRSSDLEDESAGIERPGRAEYGARGIVRHAAHVHCRNGEAPDLAATTSHVQIVDGSGANANSLANLPEEPSGLLTLVMRREDGVAHQGVHALRTQGRFVRDPHFPIPNLHRVAEVVFHFHVAESNPFRGPPARGRRLTTA